MVAGGGCGRYLDMEGGACCPGNLVGCDGWFGWCGVVDGGCLVVMVVDGGYWHWMGEFGVGGGS